jgi:Domain of unknown function (DUF5753)
VTVLSLIVWRVSGLLQTSGYAQALAEADPSMHDAAARDSAAEAVLARQHAILNKPGLELHLVIGEAALHQQVGRPEVMQKQLAMLAQAAGDSGPITVQVLPVRGCLEGQDDLNAYAPALDQLRAFALSPAQSALLRFLCCAVRWLVFRDGMGSGPVGIPPRRSREERCG